MQAKGCRRRRKVSDRNIPQRTRDKFKGHKGDHFGKRLNILRWKEKLTVKMFEKYCAVEIGIFFLPPQMSGILGFFENGFQTEFSRFLKVFSKNPKKHYFDFFEKTFENLEKSF